MADFGLDSIVQRDAVTCPGRRTIGHLQGNIRVRQPTNAEEWESFSVWK